MPSVFDDLQNMLHFLGSDQSDAGWQKSHPNSGSSALTSQFSLGNTPGNAPLPDPSGTIGDTAGGTPSIDDLATILKNSGTSAEAPNGLDNAIGTLQKSSSGPILSSTSADVVPGSALDMLRQRVAQGGDAIAEAKSGRDVLQGAVQRLLGAQQQNNIAAWISNPNSVEANTQLAKNSNDLLSARGQLAQMMQTYKEGDAKTSTDLLKSAASEENAQELKRLMIQGQMSMLPMKQALEQQRQIAVNNAKLAGKDANGIQDQLTGINHAQEVLDASKDMIGKTVGPTKLAAEEFINNTTPITVGKQDITNTQQFRQNMVDVLNSLGGANKASGFAIRNRQEFNVLLNKFGAGDTLSHEDQQALYDNLVDIVARQKKSLQTSLGNKQTALNQGADADWSAPESNSSDSSAPNVRMYNPSTKSFH